MKRRAFATLAAWPLSIRAADTALPYPSPLRDVARAAALQRQPLVLLVSLPGCPFCEMARRSYLLPMRRDEGLHAFQIDVDDARRQLAGFQGEATHAVDLVQAWKVSITPTVLFFGPSGQELADRLVGIAVPDFYGAYLDQRLETARGKLKAI